MIDPKHLIGKPLVVYVEDERRQIGTITGSALKEGSIYIAATIDLSEGENREQD